MAWLLFRPKRTAGDGSSSPDWMASAELSGSERPTNATLNRLRCTSTASPAGRRGLGPDLQTSEWIDTLSDEFYAKLVAVGLVESRAPKDVPQALEPFLDAYLSRRTDAKPGTRVFYGHTIRNLTTFFAGRTLESISPAEADDFRRWLQTHEKLSPATVARRCSLARTFFRDAVRRRLISANPFEGVGGGPKNNPDRSQFIDRETIQRAIDAAPSAEWRCLIALSRYGGLRIPSEAMSLKWDDINWEHDRMTVTAPKTEHHQGKGTRVCPVFPELRPYLDDLFAIAPPGSVYVLETLRNNASKQGDWRGSNYRTHFLRIIKRAGLTPWPRLWHNLRASRQTELVEQFPAHVAAAWLGNTEKIADKHYLQVLDRHFEKATQNPTQTGCESTRTEVKSDAREMQKPLENRGFASQKVGDTGFEPVTSTV